MTQTAGPTPTLSGDRFHTDALHRVRGRGALRFPQSESFTALIASARQTASIRARGVPSPNPFALQPDTLTLLEALLDVLRPAQILEFGSGASTVVFAKWSTGAGSRFISVEHDRGWLEKVKRDLPEQDLAAASLRHAPLRLARNGPKLFFTYKELISFADVIAETQFVLVDGPHVSGREPVLRLVLSRCRPGAVVVIDDCRHYAIREMLLDLAPSVANCFVGVDLDDNSHGLCILRCESTVGAVPASGNAMMSVLRSYWRCVRDYRQYGSGD